jgi:hypothetical protein
VGDRALEFGFLREESSANFLDQLSSGIDRRWAIAGDVPSSGKRKADQDKIAQACWWRLKRGARPVRATGAQTDSNELATEAVRKYPNRFAIMGWFYLDDPNGRDLVARWKERPGMLGLRYCFNERHKREWMTGGSLDWL